MTQKLTLADCRGQVYVVIVSVKALSALSTHCQCATEDVGHPDVLGFLRNYRYSIAGPQCTPHSGLSESNQQFFSILNSKRLKSQLPRRKSRRRADRNNSLKRCLDRSHFCMINFHGEKKLQHRNFCAGSLPLSAELIGFGTSPPTSSTE